MTPEEKAVVDSAIGLLIELTQKLNIGKILGNVEPDTAHQVSFKLAPYNALKDAVRAFAIAQPDYKVGGKGPA